MKYLQMMALTGMAAAATLGSAATPAPASPAPAPAEVHILPVQGNISMLVGAGGNITVQTGSDGVLLVDSGLAANSDKVLAAVRSLSDKPVHYIIDTHVHADHVGGNEAIAKSGTTIAGGNVVGDIGSSASNRATIIAFQTVADRMSTPAAGAPAAPAGALPTDTYTTLERKIFFDQRVLGICVRALMIAPPKLLRRWARAGRDGHRF